VRGLRWTWALLPLVVGAAASAGELPKSPWELLGLAGPERGLSDVLPVCAPGGEAPELAAAVRLARRGAVDHALLVLNGRGGADGEALPVSEPLLRTILEARVRPGFRLHDARTELARRLREVDSRAARTCGWLERARLGLRGGLPAEAMGDLALAARAAPEGASELSESIAFYRAEALRLLGQREEAERAFRELSFATQPRVAWVAQTELASTELGRDAAALREQFELGASIGVDMDPWAARAGELALQAGQVGDAVHWFSRAEQVAGGDELSALRKADALSLEGRRAAAGRLFARLERTGARAVTREVAALRLALAEGEDAAKREQRLQFVARSLAPGVAARGLVALAQLYLADARPDEALAVVGRLRTLAPRDGVAELDRLANAAVELAVEASDDCVTTVRRLAGGRDAWLGSIESPAPLSRLGDCALELGLPSTAADAYRALGRRFPQQLGPELAQRIAEVSWELGERSVVESMLAAGELRIEQDGASFEQRAPWLRLRAEMSRKDGDLASALPLLCKLAESPETPPRERSLAVATLTALPDDPSTAAALGSTLEAALQWDRDLSPEQRGTVWLRVADLRQSSGREQAAQRAYRKAAEWLPPGPARGRTLHALAAAAPAPAAREQLLEQLARGDASSAWTDLARGELRLASLKGLLEDAAVPAR